MRALIRNRRADRVDAGPMPAARAREERGFVLILAIMILLVVTVLLAAIGAAAVDVNNTSSSVISRDRAAAAADAGLQVALFRLDTTGGSTGATGSLGNGASYTYAVSSLSSSSAPCAGLWVQSSGQAVQQACITSTGSVDGRTVRTQDRVVAYTPQSPIFPVDGIFAADGFSANNNFTDTGDIRSNGSISFGNNASVSGSLEYLSSSPPSGIACTGSCTSVPESSALPVPTSSATSATAYANAAATNNDGALAWGSNTYSAATNTVTAGSGTGGTVTFPSGTYYFCNIALSNSTTLQASTANTQPVIIYIDSPYDTSSKCASGTGNMTAGNNFSVTNPSLNPSKFQIYFYGEPGCTTSCPDDFTQNDQTYSDVEVYAPYSSLTTTNNISMTGDLVIGTIDMKNNASFTYASSSGGSPGNGALANYYPSAHETCLPPTTAGGTSGTC